MNPYKHQQLRNTFDLTWREEYVLGVIAEYGDVKRSFVTELAITDRVYKWDSAKYVIARLTERGFITTHAINGKTTQVRLAHQGNVYLTNLKELYKSSAS